MSLLSFPLARELGQCSVASMAPARIILSREFDPLWTLARFASTHCVAQRWQHTSASNTCRILDLTFIFSLRSFVAYNRRPLRIQ